MGGLKVNGEGEVFIRTSRPPLENAAALLVETEDCSLV